MHRGEKVPTGNEDFVGNWVGEPRAKLGATCDVAQSMAWESRVAVESLALP